MISAVAELGGQIILVREINQRPAESPKIIGNFLVLKLFLYSVAFILGLAFTWILGYSGDLRIWLVLGLLSMFFSFPLSIGAVFQARLNIWYGVAISLAAKVIVLGTVLLMVWLNKGLVLILWGNIAVSLISAAVCWKLIHKWEKPDYRPDWKFILDLLRQSAPVGMLLLVGGVLFRSDVLLLSKMSDARSLGLYTATYKYVELGLLVVTGLLISHLPVFSQYLGSDPEKVRRLFRISSEVSGLFLIPVSVFVGFNAAGLIKLVSGPAYVEGAAALAILIWVVLLNSWNSMSSNMLIADRKIGILIVVYAPVMAANLAVNYFGIPKYGYMICAFSSVLSEVLAIIPLLVLMHKWYRVSPGWLDSAKHLLLSVVSAVITQLVPGQNIFVRLVIFISVWGLAGTATRTMDIARLREIVSKVRGQ
ncbi:MAG: oligosaccharide flippase family protein, partial [Desulfocucumaceae bacterium]